jgi:hypothetical protein
VSVGHETRIGRRSLGNHLLEVWRLGRDTPEKKMQVSASLDKASAKLPLAWSTLLRAHVLA